MTIKADSTSSNKNKTIHSSPKKRKIILQAKHKILSKPKIVKQ